MLIKSLLLFIGVVSLTACVSSAGKDTDVISADKSAGIVKVGFQNFHGGEVLAMVKDGGVKANWDSGMFKAQKVCQKWGYSDAEWLNNTVMQDGSQVAQDFYRLIQCVN